MKSKIVAKCLFKMGDVVNNIVVDEVRRAAKALVLSDDEAEILVELRSRKEYLKMLKWIKYGEYLTVEFDTEAMTATVLDARGPECI